MKLIENNARSQRGLEKLEEGLGSFEIRFMIRGWTTIPGKRWSRSGCPCWSRMPRSSPFRRSDKVGARRRICCMERCQCVQTIAVPLGKKSGVPCLDQVCKMLAVLIERMVRRRW